MLVETERAQGQRSDKAILVRPAPKSFKATDEKAGISHTQATRRQKLAAIPEAVFEATFAKPDRKLPEQMVHLGELAATRDARHELLRLPQPPGPEVTIVWADD